MGYIIQIEVLVLVLKGSANIRICIQCGLKFETAGKSLICYRCKSPDGQSITPREQQMIDLILQAKRNKEISSELNLTTGTVKAYLNRLYRKIGVSDRQELIVMMFKKKMAEGLNNPPA